MACIPFTNTWIEPGKILIGSIPQTAESYLALRNTNGIQAIATLTRRDPQTYAEMPQWTGLEWHYAPIPDGGITDDVTMLEAAGFIDKCYESDLPVYVHCRGGIGRSGTVLIAYYVLYRGMSIEQARDMVRVRRNYEGNASAADQGSPQKEWIDSLGRFK